MTAMELSVLRRDRITGSRLPKVLGLSPYGSRSDCLREMVRENLGESVEFESNFITEYGNEHEPDAIAEYEMTRGVVVHGGQDFVLHPTVGFLGATPDGLIGTDGVLETKCPWRALYSHISQRPDYEAQIRLQLECTQREWADFVVWRPDGISVSRVMHDPEWLPSILGQLVEFMDEYRSILADPELAAPFLAPLVDQRTDADWQAAAQDYLECLAAQGAAEREATDAKARLVELAGTTRSTRGGGVLVTRTTPSASVSYKKALEKYAPDADLAPFMSGGGGEPSFTVRKSSTT